MAPMGDPSGSFGLRQARGPEPPLSLRCALGLWQERGSVPSGRSRARLRVGDGCGCPTQATTPPPFPPRGQGGRRPLRLHTRRIVLPGPGRKDFLHPGQGMTWGIRVPAAHSHHGRAGHSGSGARPSPTTSPAAGPQCPRVPRPPWLWPRLTLLELASCDPTSERGHGSRALPARWLWGCPSSTQGGQGAAAMRGGRAAPLGHGDRSDGGHGGARGHRQVRARAGEGSQASGPASAGGRELPSPSPSPHGGGGRQAGERSPSHMVGWRRSRCPGNS